MRGNCSSICSVKLRPLSLFRDPAVRKLYGTLIEFVQQFTQQLVDFDCGEGNQEDGGRKVAGEGHGRRRYSRHRVKEEVDNKKKEKRKRYCGFESEDVERRGKMLVQHSHNVRGEKKTGNARKNKNARGNLKDVTPVRAVCRSGQKRSEYKSAKSVFAEGSKQFVQKAAVRSVVLALPARMIGRSVRCGHRRGQLSGVVAYPAGIVHRWKRTPAEIHNATSKKSDIPRLKCQSKGPAHLHTDLEVAMKLSLDKFTGDKEGRKRQRVHLMQPSRKEVFEYCTTRKMGKRKDETIVEVDGYYLTRSEAQSLGPRRCVNGTVITLVGRLLMEEQKLESNLENLLPRHVGYNIAECELIFAPLNVNNHWSCYVLEPKRGKMFVLDSLNVLNSPCASGEITQGNKSKDECRGGRTNQEPTIIQVMRDKFILLLKKLKGEASSQLIDLEVEVVKMVSQPDIFSCGLYVVYCLRHWDNEVKEEWAGLTVPAFTIEQLSDMRVDIVNWLSTHPLNMVSESLMASIVDGTRVSNPKCITSEEDDL
ncbi:uncharacterized protein LOC129316002 isoform X3 [Prosopis cineraria]|uniref:uncharacterized protein LOC129295773 isoform X3 n=1 Tax=Prosopis cineraria TaxID=364024 RepID=UPI0024109432|nr:uncharacterized protein LOC129295773 isoform X3 [Prosopis cineraria]XP_054816196.1 uncharacterized protein LOC129316002 isoform X3 [Prosopis cineraria]